MIKPLAVPPSTKGLYRRFLTACRTGLLQGLRIPKTPGFGIKLKDMLFLFSYFLLSMAVFAQHPAKKFVLVIHGGAGTILKSQMSPEKEKAYTDALNEALEKGSAL
ncbi:MAG: hypothetical protein ACXWWA_10865, partial [Chitinophagaceae bacterium]